MLFVGRDVLALDNPHAAVAAIGTEVAELFEPVTTVVALAVLREEAGVVAELLAASVGWIDHRA